MPNHGCNVPVFFKWETAEVYLHLGGAPGILTDTDDVVLTLVQDPARLDLHKSDLTIEEADDNIYVKLTQEQAGMFAPAPVLAQVNILKGGDRIVSEQGLIHILGNICDEEL